VVDMRDDGEIADILDRDRRHGREITPRGPRFNPKREIAREKPCP
jgi:hypothetical protein